MKKIRNAFLVVMLSLCSLMSYADQYDTDYLTIPQDKINATGSIKPQLVEKAATIFGEKYSLTLTNIYLSQHWFYCDIIIEKFDGTPCDLSVEQTVTENQDYYVEFPQELDVLGTISTISEPSSENGYDIMVHSEVRVYNNGIARDITVTYHFINHWKHDDYYLVITFPYNGDTWTGIEDIDMESVKVEYYDLMGRKLDGPRPGIVIEKQGNKTTKKLYR